MSGSRLNWNGPKCQAKIKTHVERLLAAAARIVLNRAKMLLSVEGTGREMTAKGTPKKRGKLIYGENPSAPGEPPHKQTGRLIASVAVEISGLIARVGTNLRYGRWLELGTSKVAARPWLRRALAECRDEIRRLFENSKMNSN